MRSPSDCVWVGFDKDGEPKQVHPVKPHGDLIGFTWQQYYPASFVQKTNVEMLVALKALQMEAAARGCGLRIADEAIAKAEKR